MRTSILSSLLVLVTLTASSEANLTCPECVMEMHKLGQFVKVYGPTISKYLAENYCTTINSPDCENHLEKHYVEMLYMVTEHFVVDGAMHICQMMMTCDAKVSPVEVDKLTCKDCLEGLKFLEGYFLDEYVIEEFMVYLEQNFCLPDMEMCDLAVKNHFPAMHKMAMTEFFIPRDICIKADVCQQ